MGRFDFKAITEKTLVPISLVITIIGAVVGAMLWLTQIYFTSEANAKTITEIKKTQVDHNSKVYDILFSIDRRLSNIEGQLKTQQKEK